MQQAKVGLIETMVRDGPVVHLAAWDALAALAAGVLLLLVPRRL